MYIGHACMYIIRPLRVMSHGIITDINMCATHHIGSSKTSGSFFEKQHVFVLLVETIREGNPPPIDTCELGSGCCSPCSAGYQL